MARFASALAALLAAALVLPAAGLAHGPCRQCLSPSQGPPGTAVRVAGPVFKIVFNPDRSDLGIGPRSLWRDHDPAFAPLVVLRESYDYSPRPPRDPGRFRVPAVPPGRYLVAIYDGSEGGSHYTWQHFRVSRRPPARDAAPDAPSSGVPVALAGALAAAALAVGALAGRRSRRPR